jgi:hypothetical protein
MRQTDCEYCGEPSTREVSDILVCDSCYFDNFSYDLDEDGEQICSVCGDESDLTANGVPYCASCFEDDESLTEEDID